MRPPFLFLLLLAWCGTPMPAAPTAASRPNILILMADDWGWPASPLYGDHAVKTPALDRIVRDGVLFTHAYCSAPSCTPSRAALFTGQDFWRLEEGANLLDYRTRDNQGKELPTVSGKITKPGAKTE